MNIAQAKRIPLADIMDKLGRKPTQHKNHEVWYLSPFRAEKTPSFHIKTKQNVWYDFGEGMGGDAIALIRLYLERERQGCSVPDALRWISNMMGYAPKIHPVAEIPEDTGKEPAFRVRVNMPLNSLILKRYLLSRGINPDVAKPFVRELYLHNNKTGKTTLALGWKNEDGGFEIKNKFLKGTVGSKDITFIRGKTSKPETIHIFEGMMDFLTVVHRLGGRPLNDDTIVLNSLSIIASVTPYIKGYGYRKAYTWMDNDPAGMKATRNLDQFFQTEESLTHYPMNCVYKSFKDVNAWHMQDVGIN